MISIFVAKLDFGVDNDQLRALFEAYGKVRKATVALDKETGKSRGFGFVEMENEQEGHAAISGLDGRIINGRNIAVKQAEDRGNAPGGPKKFDGGNKPGYSSSPSAPRPNYPPRNDQSSSNTSGARPSTPESFIPPIIPNSPSDNRKKTLPKDKDRKTETEADRNKKPKMDAYKKSGKKDKFLDDDEDLELEGGLFSFDEEEEDDE
jgi:RNA recognition motif-containing protein